MRALFDLEIARVSGSGSSTTTSAVGEKATVEKGSMTGNIIFNDGGIYQTGFEGDFFEAWNAWNAKRDSLENVGSTVFVVHGSSQSSTIAAV